jgi:hypothetical protein
VVLISKSIQPVSSSASNLIQLTDGDEVERGAVLTFSLRAQSPAAFTQDAKVEVSGADDTVLATLTLSHGLVLEDAQVALATLNTSEAFNPSTFGPLRFRIVYGDAGAGDWLPLATLVRLPVLHDLRCVSGHNPHCQLTGSNLFLIEALSTDRAFDHPVVVPEGFTGGAVLLPRSAGRQLFVRLHDDPTVTNQVAFPAEEQRTAAVAKPMTPVASVHDATPK